MGIEGSPSESQLTGPALTAMDKPETPANIESDAVPTVEMPTLSLPENEKPTEQEQLIEDTEMLRQRFEGAAKLGRSWMSESRQREDRGLAPYLNQQFFNPECIKALRSREQLTPADVEAARNASMAISLQAADQILLAKLSRQEPERALKQHTLENEVDSLGKIDSMLGAGFHRAQVMIKEDQANQLIQQARQVIAYRQKISPDQVKTSDQQVLEWVKKTIQEAGKRVRRHRDQAKGLWAQGRGSRRYTDPLYPSQ